MIIWILMDQFYKENLFCPFSPASCSRNSNVGLLVNLYLSRDISTTTEVTVMLFHTGIHGRLMIHPNDSGDSLATLPPPWGLYLWCVSETT